MAAERLAAGSSGSPAASAKARRADDGVVAPVVALVAMPEREARRDRRPVGVGGELLQALQQRLATHESRHRLNETGLGIGLHGGGERNSVPPDMTLSPSRMMKRFVRGAEALDPIGDVAGFAPGVLRCGGDSRSARCRRVCRAESTIDRRFLAPSSSPRVSERTKHVEIVDSGPSCSSSRTIASTAPAIRAGSS